MLLSVRLFIPCVTLCCCFCRTALLCLGQVAVVNENFKCITDCVSVHLFLYMVFLDQRAREIERERGGNRGQQGVYSKYCMREAQKEKKIGTGDLN